MYFMLAYFPGVIKGLWAVRHRDDEHTFLSTNDPCLHNVGKELRVPGCSPAAVKAPTSRRSQASPGILQQRTILAGHKTSAYGCTGEQTVLGGTRLLL